MDPQKISNKNIMSSEMKLFRRKPVWYAVSHPCFSAWISYRISDDLAMGKINLDILSYNAVGSWWSVLINEWDRSRKITNTRNVQLFTLSTCSLPTSIHHCILVFHGWKQEWRLSFNFLRSPNIFCLFHWLKMDLLEWF